MSRLQLSKSSLSNQNKSLKIFKQFLPSLDLKRKQLMLKKMQVKKELIEIKAQIEEIYENISDYLPMLANKNIKVEDLVSIKEANIEKENIVGVKLPILKNIEFDTKEYSFFMTPHWVDSYVKLCKEVITLKLNINIKERRLSILDEAITKVTQRVNLFDKVLIPKAISNIKKIQISLSDNECASVVRSKIAKKKMRAT